MAMHQPGSPQEQVFWYLKRAEKPKTFSGTLHTDIIIVGGGMAGLSAAQAFASRGQKVTLLEQYYCGSGATGKSTGFITPDAELNITRFEHLYGNNVAHTIWEFINRGIETIRTNIKTHDLNCGYREQDTLVLANSARAAKKLHKEHENRLSQNYESTWYSQETSKNVIGSYAYYGGYRYGGTFGINAYAYAQEIKKVVQDLGVTIYEEMPVLELHTNHVTTPTGTVHAAHIVVCTDRFTPTLGALNNDIFHVQNNAMISHPLNDATIAKLFPDKPCLTWDSDLIYTFWCMTDDNRLLIGGGNYWNAYRKQENYHAHSVYNKLKNYVQTKFPDVKITFEYTWPGLIGISKDIAPIMGRDPEFPSIYYAGAAAGLPIAASMGIYSAEHLIDGRTDLDEYFKPNRSSIVSTVAQKIIGKPATFALSNLYTLMRN
jgi:gamma-glutamylputrescine oxidase